MNKLQLRVLYRQFLFRVFDLEVLSAHAQGDANKLLGQFAALLIFVSLTLALGAIIVGDSGLPGRDPRDSELPFLMVAQHFLIATSMLVIGLFAVLSWDATFPDRRDVLVLGPLPIRPHTIFLAKVAAVATSLGLTIVLLHCAMGLILPLVFAVRASPARLPALTLDPTPLPLAPRDLPAVMNRDLRQQLTSGELAPGTGAGLAIAVSKHGERRVFTYGTAKADSLFEIGSLTKTFTGLLLARLVAAGQVQLTEPVRQLLPAGTVAKPDGTEITLLDLATHHSGLPPMPDNFHPADRANPYADYGAVQLYAYLSKHGLIKSPDATFLYSNLGVGLLGQALADRSHLTYPDLLSQQITGPLALRDTVIKLSADQQRRFLPGHDAKHHRVPAWDLDGLAGAGALRSTAGDMLTYLEANLHPEKYPSLSRALALSQQVRDSAGAGAQIALVWLYSADTGTYRHGGATAGFSSHAFFDPPTDSAAVVLFNSGPNPLLSADVIGEHIRQRLAGEPAISLDTVLVPASSGWQGIVRSFAAYWFTMFAAGIFVYTAVLATQGVAAQLLPRQLFLRLSGYLQLAAIGVIVGVYFLQPGFGGFDDLTVASVARLIQWLPSYWFLALYQQLNGSLHPALLPLAQRAWFGLSALVCGTALLYLVSYWRTVRKIVEEPDIVPALPRWHWLPDFGSQPQTAIAQFTVRTLARSRQHRLIVGFYLGIGLAFTCLLLKGSGDPANNPWSERNMLLWVASLMLLVLAAVGTRVAFALPLDLRANWVFRITGTLGNAQHLAATRRALLLLAVAPIWLATALGCMALRPGWPNLAHLAVLALVGLILADVCLLRFRKIPFTCSYLPGKSRVHMIFLLALGVLVVGAQASLLERRALHKPASAAVLLASLSVAWLAVRRVATSQAAHTSEDLRFEEETPPVVQGLGLFRDGVMPPGN